MKEPHVEALIELFNQLFKDSLNTILVKGKMSPFIFLPMPTTRITG